MDELIKIEKNSEGIEVVSARELYKKLGYDQSQFSRFVKSKIIDNEFSIQNIDYQEIDIEVEIGNGVKRNVHDYALTIDFAKKLSMIAKTEIGEKIREYFIAREKQAKELEKQQLPKDYLSALKALVVSEEQKQLAQQKVKELEPKAESFDVFIDSFSLQGFKEVANMLGYGRNKFMATLRNLKILTSMNIPYQNYLDMGLFEVKESTQNGFNIAVTYVTPKGIDYLRKKIKMI